MLKMWHMSRPVMAGRTAQEVASPFPSECWAGTLGLTGQEVKDKTSRGGISQQYQKQAANG